MELGVERCSFRRELNLHHLGKPNLILLQAGKAVGNRFGQLRNVSTGQINAGASLLRFLIERAAFLNEVSDVGNVNRQVPVSVIRFR